MHICGINRPLYFSLLKKSGSSTQQVEEKTPHIIATQLFNITIAGAEAKLIGSHNNLYTGVEKGSGCYQIAVSDQGMYDLARLFGIILGWIRIINDEYDAIQKDTEYESGSFLDVRNL